MPAADVPSTEAATAGPVVTEPDVPSTVAASTTTSVTTPPPTTSDARLPAPALHHLADVFNYLVRGNDAVSVSVVRDHAQVFGLAAGIGASGQPVTPDTPLVLASVSKLITALTIARLVEAGKVMLDQPVPWDAMGIAHDPAWNDVTVRELLTHTSGMPIARASWLDKPGGCPVPLAEAMARPPTATRGRWTYSNGNYCALGLLVEQITGGSQQQAAERLVFEPIGVTGPHSTSEGLLAGDGPYEEGVARLERLGGAGTWMASTDDISLMLDSVTAADRETLAWPAIITDQYGWGHTGTVDGAKACAWVMEGGRTVVTAIVAGDRPSSGGRVCDAVLPALAADLGVWADKPVRNPD